METRDLAKRVPRSLRLNFEGGYRPSRTAERGDIGQSSRTYDIVQQHGHVTRRLVLVQLVPVRQTPVWVLRGGLAPKVSQKIGKLSPRLARRDAVSVATGATLAVAQVRVVHVPFVVSRHRVSCAMTRGARRCDGRVQNLDC